MAEWLDDHEECDRQIAALTQERDEALLGYGRVLNTLQFYKQKFEDPDEMLAAATEIATENSRLTQEREELAKKLSNMTDYRDEWVRHAGEAVGYAEGLQATLADALLY